MIKNYFNFKHCFVFLLGLALGFILFPGVIFGYSFVDEFNNNTIKNVYTGDETNSRTRIDKKGAGQWDVWYQNWWRACPGGNETRNCYRGGCQSCSWCDNEISSGQCPEYYGTNPGNAKVSIRDDYLNIYRDGNDDGVVGACQDRSHRFPFIRSESFETTSNFLLQIRTMISTLEGWGVGWGIKDIVGVWYERAEDNVNIKIDGVGTFTAPAATLNGHWLKIEVQNHGTVRQVWIYNDDNPNSPVEIWSGSGNVSFPPSGTKNVWFGNSDDNPDRYSLAYQSWCKADEGNPNDGMGNWPRLWIDYIRINFGPENGPVAVLQPPGSVCVSEDSGAVRFQSVVTDSDGWNNQQGGLKYVSLIINTTANGNTAAEEGNPVGAFKGIYVVRNFDGLAAGRFYIRNDNDTAWLELAGSEVSNTYATLKNTSSVLGSGNTLTINWDIVFKSAWVNEAAKLWLRAEDMTGLYDGWTDAGDFGIDNSLPAVPGNPSPANGSCLDSPNPVLSALSSDTGCGSADVRYQFRLDYNSSHQSWDEQRTQWGDNTWETNFNLENGVYYWQAKAKDGVENASDWSDWWNFKIPCNESPSAVSLSAIPGDYCDCGTSCPPISLSWTFSDPDVGDSQTAYQIQIDNTPGFPSPEDTRKIISSSNTYAPLNLSYNTTYYWRIKVWDNHDAESVWANGLSFVTAKHAWPAIDFSWTPGSPRVNQPVLFEDQSTVYGGASKVSWQWNFQEGFATSSSNLRNVVNECLSAGVKIANLRVTDSDGYFCDDSRSVPCGGAFLPPQWQEIPPILWLEKFFAEFFGIFQYALAF